MTGMNPSGRKSSAYAAEPKTPAFKAVIARWWWVLMPLLGIVCAEAYVSPHVADSANKRAVLLDPQGKLLSRWMLEDDDHPEVYSPTRVAADSRRAYLVDTSNDRIVVLEVR